MIIRTNKTYKPTGLYGVDNALLAGASDIYTNSNAEVAHLMLMNDYTPHIDKTEYFKNSPYDVELLDILTGRVARGFTIAELFLYAVVDMIRSYREDNYMHDITVYDDFKDAVVSFNIIDIRVVIVFIDQSSGVYTPEMLRAYQELSKIYAVKNKANK